MKRIKQFFKHLNWLEQERIKAMIYSIIQNKSDCEIETFNTKDK